MESQFGLFYFVQSTSFELASNGHQLRGDQYLGICDRRAVAVASQPVRQHGTVAKAEAKQQ